MNIGNVSLYSGLPVKTIRYYEDIGLVSPDRDTNGYRLFKDEHLHKLTFVGRARSLGFSLDDCRELITLYEDRDGAAAEARTIAQHHIRNMEQKIRELQSMTATLQHLVDMCDQEDRPVCPILSDLAQERGGKIDEETSSRDREKVAVDSRELKA